MLRASSHRFERVRKIVDDLKDFSRTDRNQEWVWANLHNGIDSTLNIVSNEIKYKAEVVKEYGERMYAPALSQRLEAKKSAP